MPTSETTFCCDTMRDQLTRTCTEHDKYECPDALIHRWANGTTGIHIKDGGSSVSVIRFCPWCGTDISVPDAGDESTD